MSLKSRFYKSARIIDFSLIFIKVVIIFDVIFALISILVGLDLLVVFWLHFYLVFKPKRAPKWHQKIMKKVEKCGTGPKNVILNLQGLRFGTTQVHLGVNLARW